MVGRSLGARELHAVTECLARHEANIERIHRLSDVEPGSFEIHRPCRRARSRRSSSARCWSWPWPRAPSTWRCSARVSTGAPSVWW
ncbi:hypothetical protein ACN28S_01015 [Cystobacter fuscus]